MKRAFVFCPMLAMALTTSLAWGQGRGGCQSGGGGASSTGGMASGGTAVLSARVVVDPAVIAAADPNTLRVAAMRQAQMQMMRQVYLAQMQAQLQAQIERQQLAAARKAEQKERRLAYWRERRETELTQRDAAIAQRAHWPESPMPQLWRTCDSAPSRFTTSYFDGDSLVLTRATKKQPLVDDKRLLCVACGGAKRCYGYLAGADRSRPPPWPKIGLPPAAGAVQPRPSASLTSDSMRRSMIVSRAAVRFLSCSRSLPRRSSIRATPFRAFGSELQIAWPRAREVWSSSFRAPGSPRSKYTVPSIHSTRGLARFQSRSTSPFRDRPAGNRNRNKN